jgi:hypothetical protein
MSFTQMEIVVIIIIIIHMGKYVNSYGDDTSLLGFLLNPYTRASDGLPITGTILFDTNNFKKQLLSGEAGMFPSRNIILC